MVDNTQSSNVLITGTSSGLGRHLLNNMGGRPFDRQAKPDHKQYHPSEPYDLIIHCAFNSAHEVGIHNIAQYMDDNAGLTERLTKIPHRKFIYASTIDVYPQSPGPYSEDYSIDARRLDGAYPVAKLMSENHIHKNCPDHLIFRLAMMVGPFGRRNTLIKVLTEKALSIGLSANSEYNILSHDTVSKFIATCLEKGLTGTFNLGSSNRVSLGELANIFGNDVAFGGFRYCSADIDVSKAAAIMPELNADSKEVILDLHARNLLPPNG